MVEKNNILEAWIMVEHLSEGDIRVRDKSILTLDDLQKGDFYTLFRREMEKKKFKPKQKGGIVLYFDIFSFKEVISILREQYHLKPTDEELRVGDKFSFALYFDRDLNLLQDMTFFTESAYIRYYKKVPREEEFRTFEDDLNKQFAQDLDETAASAEKFNAAIQKELDRYEIQVKNCRIQVLNNVETEGTNLHSFFIQDLEKAKEIETENLHAYLYGQRGQRINLDSKKESAHFNPGAFEEILQPSRYPLGRFPSKTAFALSLMQQVAVNLSIGADPQPIRSVNGPPGTGKTTLLKDIFAQLIVQQAYDIANLSERCIKGTEETVYFKQASIGVIPAQITENSIVVASSNNGAVQNIVNELPLCQGIDEALLEELKEADYFRKLANAKLSAQWKEDENGKKREELVCEPSQGEEKFWGDFSLEGGRSDNMTQILTNMKHICKYLEEEYLPPEEDVYKAFLEQYEQVRTLRTQAQAFARGIQGRGDRVRELEQTRRAYQAESVQRRAELEDRLLKLKDRGQALDQRLQELTRRLSQVQRRRESTKESRHSLELCLDAAKARRPGLFAGRSAKEDHRNQLSEITSQLMALRDEDRECIAQENKLRGEIDLCQKERQQSAAEPDSLREKFAGWKRAKEEQISTLASKVRDDEAGGSRVKPLDMQQDYDALQLSNPWFDEPYRIAQSRLFIAALRVRKHFLFENRKNLLAAASIWRQQEKYLDRKSVIQAAWNWINMTIPVISSTFASFSNMCRNLGPETLGHLFIDEAGQALPQAAVGAVFRSRHVMVVGDPSQIKPVLTLDSNTLYMLSNHFEVSEKYLSASASAQTLVDAASRYGFYRKQDLSEESWIGIPLWVHRRCQYPMFTISNVISYDGFMVQGMEKYGKTGWFDIGGKANNKYVAEQGEFLAQKIRSLMEQDPKIGDKKEKDVIYVITPFSNVAYQLSRRLEKIGFTRYEQGKPTNVGTVHTFQGKEAPVVFFVLGADFQSAGAARWAMSEPNMMNVAATRAKQEFYIIGDRKLYLGLGCDVATDTDRIIRQYKQRHPDLVEDAVPPAPVKKAPEPAPRQGAPAEVKKAPEPAPRQGAPAEVKKAPEPVPRQGMPAPGTGPRAQAAGAPVQSHAARPERMAGEVRVVRQGTRTVYAYVSGDDGNEYYISETISSKLPQAEEILQRGKRISFVPQAGRKKPYATEVEPETTA